MSTEKLTRNYSDWLNTLANIGGFTELIFIFFTWIYIFYHHCSQRNYLKEALFGRGASSGNETDDIERQNLIEEDLEQSSSLEDSIRELQGLRILNEVNFEDYHVALLPDLLLSIRKEKKSLKKKLETAGLTKD